jgi:hypothetical protein
LAPLSPPAKRLKFMLKRADQRPECRSLLWQISAFGQP